MPRKDPAINRLIRFALALRSATFQDFNFPVVVRQLKLAAAAIYFAVQRITADNAGRGNWQFTGHFSERRAGGDVIFGVLVDIQREAG